MLLWNTPPTHTAPSTHATTPHPTPHAAAQHAEATMADKAGEKFDVDHVIDQLLEVRGARPGKPVNLTEFEITQLCQRSRDILMQQPILLELEAPLKICGDIHGQFYDLLRLFEYGGFPPEANYLFLGDYVDRGKQSLETICLLLAYKIKYPENFFILRGNHECASINRIYGFYDECKRRYNIKLWKTFTDCFNSLPVAAIIDEKIFCMHGGLSPDLRDMSQIKCIMRPTDVPDVGLVCDLLWADPDKDVQGWGENDRGVSYTFGPDVVKSFLRKHDLDLVARAHQVVEDGYEFFAKRQLVTLFSAPNYCGEFDNAGAMMSVDETLMCCEFVARCSLALPRKRGAPPVWFLSFSIALTPKRTRTLPHRQCYSFPNTQARGETTSRTLQPGHLWRWRGLWGQKILVRVHGRQRIEMNAQAQPKRPPPFDLYPTTLACRGPAPIPRPRPTAPTPRRPRKVVETLRSRCLECSMCEILLLRIPFAVPEDQHCPSAARPASVHGPFIDSIKLSIVH